MANVIHPTAIIDPNAKLGQNNYIGPFCYIGPYVEMGNDNRLEAYVSIGTPAEHRDYYRKTPGPVRIGNECIFREFVTVNGGAAGLTQIGNCVVMLRGSYLAHDCVAEDRVTLSGNVMVGGHSRIHEGANLGLGVAVHQFRVIGAYAMVGMNATITRNIPPFVVAYGSPCKAKKINRVGLQRSGVNERDLSMFEDWFQSYIGRHENPKKLAHLYQRFVDSYLNESQGCAAVAPKKTAA